MDTNSIVIPPRPDEVEVSVFGPGFGESILIHLGLNEWVIVDSCLERNLKTPSPIHYLRKLGVETSRAVKLIVASHWHDDHVGGLEGVVRRCPSAKFVCSEAQTTEEFFKLAASIGIHSMMESSGIDEFSKVWMRLASRQHGRNASKGPDDYAVANCQLFQRIEHLPCTVHSLSPSAGSVSLAKAEISSLLPTQALGRERKKRLVALRPNNVAVALWINIGQRKILLGSDLEETADERTGWSVIVDSSNRPDGKASVFKIPHHGSKNGDQPRVWTDMLHPNPIAVLTPFMNGGVSLPTKQDADRICRKTNRAYSTAGLGKRNVRRPSSVERTIKEVTRSIRVVSGSSGHVRLRAPASPQDAEWQVELFGDALPLGALSKTL